jgi:hypothetical protein
MIHLNQHLVRGVGMNCHQTQTVLARVWGQILGNQLF